MRCNFDFLLRRLYYYYFCSSNCRNAGQISPSCKQNNWLKNLNFMSNVFFTEKNNSYSFKNYHDESLETLGTIGDEKVNDLWRERLH